MAFCPRFRLAKVICLDSGQYQALPGAYESLSWIGYRILDSSAAEQLCMQARVAPPHHEDILINKHYMLGSCDIMTSFYNFAHHIIYIRLSKCRQTVKIKRV